MLTAIGEPFETWTSKKPRRACAQQATSQMRGGPSAPPSIS
jgi:hypothetical protein